ncbi:site-specific DNA-methyltransferase [Cytobacillus gottheilii]|uniref:site-specific DNA-methyltransferase n=1 Tax=Cytobacillus gottheilii TaxID=859144 RepID=UPI000833C22A|nr:site-specific DNA-methyltransferase [Cytobacillus gottheilii]
MFSISNDNEHSVLYFGDSLDHYKSWPNANTIISDGPYGVNGFKGDTSSPKDLPEVYEPHIKEWTKHAQPGATLWFWNTEIGWALVHPILEKYGWEYNGTNIWDKGIGYIAGNSNSKTLSKFPIVTEVCVQYILKPRFCVNGQQVEEKVWLRDEWQRTGLPLYKTNEACGVKNAATRKYFTQCHLWYSPPPEQFEKIVKYANEHGNPDGKPYFSLDGNRSLTQQEWVDIHPKFYCPIGVTNVWDEPMVAGEERVRKTGSKKAAHSNQKPLKLMKLIIESSSDKGDVIWEPFGGLCSAMYAAIDLGRRAYGSEINEEFFELAKERLNGLLKSKEMASSHDLEDCKKVKSNKTNQLSMAL